MRILIATDAWRPQINGVVRVLETTAQDLEAFGHEVKIVGPGEFRTIPAPGYAEIRLAMFPGRRLARIIETFRPDAIHIPVEGPIGIAARRYCLRHKIAFTTSFHTRFGDYFEYKLGISPSLAYGYQRWFHNAGDGMMVQTLSLEKNLADRGFRNIRSWGRGVDTELFRPYRDDPDFDPDFLGLPRPIFLYLGRVSTEKNLDAFFKLDLPGSKVVVGDGPSTAGFRKTYKDVHFLGYRSGADLARHFSAADAFVFPSKFETFGLVVLEALACGTPVAAFPVAGPLDIIGDRPHGVLSDDLKRAALQALAIDRKGCRDFAETFSWEECSRQFETNLIRGDRKAVESPRASALRPGAAGA